MSRIHAFWSRLNATLRRRRFERDMAEELEQHLEQRIEKNRMAGMSPSEAREAALRAFGGLEQIKERGRDSRRWRWLEDFLQDARLAARQLRKAPGFTAIAIASLATGIGANTVVFGVLNTVVFCPLAVRDPQNLFQVRSGAPSGGRMLTTSYPAFEELRDRNTSFAEMAAFYGYSVASLRWANSVTKIRGFAVTGNYFDVLGVEAELGRCFHAVDEHGPGSAPYIVLSDALWRNVFNGAPDVIGAVVELNKHPFTVVGVAPEAFHGTERFEWPDYWIPLVNKEQVDGWETLHNRSVWAVTVLGRLKPGTTPQRATEDLNRIAADQAREHPTTDRGVSLRLIHPGLFADDGQAIRSFIYGVTTLAFLVLVAACANLAGLLAARTFDRRRELALRAALGSTQSRLARLIMAEAVVICALGGIAGVAVAHTALAALNHWEPPFGYGGQRLGLHIVLEARIYFCGVVLSLVSAGLFGLMPARQAWCSSPLEMIKGAPHNRGFRRFAARDWLLGLQIAACTLLVAACAASATSLMRALHGSLGIRPDGATLVSVDLSDTESTGSVLETQKALLDAAAKTPGTFAVGATSGALGAGAGSRDVLIFRPDTAEFATDKAVTTTQLYSVTPGYMAAAGTRFLGGRDFAWQDSATTPLVAIVNAAFARKLWPGSPAVGQRFIISGRLREVVGVVEDGKYHDLMESTKTAVFLPLSQAPRSEVVLVVRSHLPAHEIGPTLLRVLSQAEPDVPITVQSWSDALRGVLFPFRAATLALSVMAGLTVMLAISGIFGMAAYSVSRRLREFGIRVALGARPQQVIAAAIERPIMVLGLGSATGCLAALASVRLLSRVVFHPEPASPTVLVVVTLTMGAIGMVSVAIPVRRALAISPSALMREE